MGVSAALGRRPWASGTAGVEGERGRATWEVDPLPRFEEWWPVGVVLRQRVAVGGGERGGGATGLIGGPVPGERRRGSRGSQSLPWLEPRCCGEGCPAMAGVRERQLR